MAPHTQTRGTLAPSATWEQVLAAVEAEVAHAETVLALSDGEDDPAGTPVDWLAVAAGPTSLPIAAALPPLEDLPAPPAHVRERVVALQQRLEQLQRMLGTALRATRWQMMNTVPPFAPEPDPLYLDRLV